MARKIDYKENLPNGGYRFGTGANRIQIGKYRDLDDFDIAMKQQRTWHGKYYASSLWGQQREKLFDTEKEAKQYGKKLFMNNEIDYKKFIKKK